MNKYKAAFLDILNFLLVHCDCKIACEDIKEMIIDVDTILRDIPIFSSPRLHYFIFYCIFEIVMPKLEYNEVTLSDILDNLKVYYNTNKELF